ncbi:MULTISPECIES: MaoC family dehydratase N-terminal domain-containing protein [unclassified Agrococcus]|uniref:FAS1-like dehydratase domain-containing protein n=1 Tax=unclassified Agrococcus TaxID=2615065 RepID=UPI003611F5EE
MPVAPDLTGRTYPPTAPYAVGREKVREFAAAVGAEHPVHHDVVAARAAGYADVVAPPTFAIVVSQRGLDQLLADETAGIELSRVVHGDQRFTIERPIVAGDELQVSFGVTGVRALGGNAMVSTEARITDAAGELVAVASSSLVVGGDA